MSGESKQGAAQMQRLSVEDLCPFLRQKSAAGAAELAQRRRFGVDPGGGAGVDRRRRVRRRKGRGGGQGLVELRQSVGGAASVEQVDGPVIAKHSGDHHVPRARFHDLGEQSVGRAIITEVGLLDRIVEDRFGASPPRHLGGAQHLEIFGRLGIKAGIVAAIGHVARARRIERACLGSGKGGGIAGFGHRHLDISRHRPVGGQSPEAEAKRAVIAARPRHVERAARRQL